MGNEPTRWTMIRGAAAGRAADREAFAARYAPVIRAYLGARWRRTPLAQEVDDAVQEVFVDCFRENGALARADPTRGRGFRAFLRGVVRHVAQRHERRRARRRERQPDSALALEALRVEEESLARVFDRAWGRAVVREAARRQLEHARDKGDRALRRHRLLALRYGEGLPVRVVAERWGLEAAFLHGQLRQAREEFRRALDETVRDLDGGSPASVEAECRRLIQAFS